MCIFSWKINKKTVRINLLLWYDYKYRASNFEPDYIKREKLTIKNVV